MLPEAMTALAATAGAGLVQAAGTDAWRELRDRVARFFGRGDPEQEERERERLDQSAHTLATAAEGELEQVRARQETAWQTRFEVLLESLPEPQRAAVAAELEAIVEAAPSRDAQATVHNEISGGTQYGPVFQGRDFHGRIFATPPPAGARPEAPGTGPA